MTGAAVLQQVQAGRYRLQDKVLRLLTPFAGLRRIAQIERVTVEQLLKHRSGLAEYYGDAFERAARKSPDKRWTAAESLAFIVDEDASDEPDAGYEYVNSNYVLLGHLVASQDGQTYEQAIRRRLIEPLRLTHTTVGADPSDPSLAHGYTLNRRGRPADVSRGGWTAITGDGAIVTTAGDYDRFVRALLRDGKVLERPMVQRMCTRQREEPDADYGMACMVIRTVGGDAWGHNGAIDGFNAEVWYLPRRDVSIVLLANGEYDADSAGIIRQVLKALDR
jgi:D-alanyl-D-alanine carboxypeptidase